MAKLHYLGQLKQIPVYIMQVLGNRGVASITTPIYPRDCTRLHVFCSLNKPKSFLCVQFKCYFEKVCPATVGGKCFFMSVN